MKIPPGWQHMKLRDCCSEDPDYGANAASTAYVAGLPRYVRITDILDSGQLCNDGVASLQEAEAAPYLLRNGDFLFARSGATVGKTYLYDPHDGRCAFAGYLIRFRPDPTILDARYLRAFAQSGRYWAWVKATIHAGAQPNINASEYGALDIPIPPISEQKLIVELIGAWDETIEKVGKLIEAKQKLKRGLTQQLLTRRGALNSAGAGQWEHARLSELFEPVTREVGEHKTTVLSITATVGFVDQAAKFSRVIAGEQLTKYVLLKRGEFSYNKGNSNAYPQGCIYMLEEFDEGAVPHVYISFRAKPEDAHPEFYKHFFAAGGLNRQLHRLINSGVRNDGLLNLDEEGFFAMRLPKPPLAEQRQIANAFSELDRELRILKAHRAALTTQKRGLMEKLLKGAIRVKVDVSALEAARA